MRGLTAIGAVLACLGGAASAAQTCLPAAEAEALGVVLLPEVVNAAAQRCASSLPADATLRAGLEPLLARWRGETAAAASLAQTAIVKLAGEEDLKGADPAALLSLTRTAMANDLVKSLKPSGCITVERAVSLAAPLPARNIAALAVMAAQAGKADNGNVPICPAPRP